MRASARARERGRYVGRYVGREGERYLITNRAMANSAQRVKKEKSPAKERKEKEKRRKRTHFKNNDKLVKTQLTGARFRAKFCWHH